MYGWDGELGIFFDGNYGVERLEGVLAVQWVTNTVLHQWSTCCVINGFSVFVFGLTMVLSGVYWCVWKSGRDFGSSLQH